MMTFPQLVQKYGIGVNHFLEYHQIKSAITKSGPKINNLELPKPTSNLIDINSRKKILSKIYKIISNSDQTLSIPSTKWEEDLQISPNADFWTTIFKNIF